MRFGLFLKPFFLIVLAVLITYHNWFLDFDIKSQGDWVYFTKETMDSLRLHYFTVWLSDYSFGRVLIDAGQAPTYVLYGLLSSNFGLEYSILERLIHFWPAVVLPLVGAYLLVKHLTNDTLSGFIAALVYGSNTYILMLYTGHLTLAVAYGLVPFAILFFIKAIQTSSYRDAVVASLWASACGFYEPRAAYILVLMLLLYGIFEVLLDFRLKGSKKRLLKKITVGAVTFTTFLFANIFWVVGLALTPKGNVSTILDRGLFGSQYFDIKSALTLFHPYWNFSEPVAFVVNPIPIYFWLIPLIAFLGFVFNKSNKTAIFFALLGLIGALLSKQTDSPLPGLYQWLFDYFPGFSAFREASKFYFITAISYAVLIGFFINKLHNSREIIIYRFRKINLAYPGAILVALIFLPNLLPIISGRIGSTFATKSIPSDYLKFNQYIDSQNEYFRVLWVPKDSRWSQYTANHPKVDTATVTDSNWKRYSLDKNEALKIDALMSPLENDYSNELLDFSTIKYVVVPILDKENDDDFFVHYGYDRAEYINRLKGLKYLHEIDIGTKELRVFENSNFIPYVSTHSSISYLDSSESLASFNKFKELEKIKEPQLLIYDNDNDQKKRPDFVNGYTFLNLFPDSVYETKLNGVTPLIAYKPIADFTIFSEIGRKSFYYEADKSSIQLGYSGSPRVLVGETEKIKSDDRTVGAVSLEEGRDYYFLDGPLLQTIDTRPEGKRYFSSTIADVNILSGSRTVENIISQDFETVDTVQSYFSDEKCDQRFNEYSRTSQLLSGFEKNTSKFLSMKSRKSNNCYEVGKIDFSVSSFFKMSFEYSISESQKVGVLIKYDNGKTRVVDLASRTDEWRNVDLLIGREEGANTASIILISYPDDKNQNSATSNFDDIKISVLRSDFNANFPEGNTINIPVEGANIGDVFIVNDHSTKNLIPNPSLEDGLWQKNVGDCNNRDDNPDLGMSLSSNASHGTRSLQLEAKRHIACTTPGAIDVKEGALYRLSFDYSSPNSTQSGYFISFNDKARSSKSQRMIDTDSDWRQKNFTFRVPYGASSMELTVYSYSDDVGSRKYINLYDNFELVQIPDLESNFFLTESPNRALIEPRDVDFKSISSTRKEIYITGATTSFFLNISEQYNPAWRLGPSSTENIDFLLPWHPRDYIDSSKHFESNGFMNGWYLDTSAFCAEFSDSCLKNNDGSYDIKLIAEFTSQRYLNFGLIFSTITVLMMLFFVAVTDLRGAYNKRQYEK